MLRSEVAACATFYLLTLRIFSLSSKKRLGYRFTTLNENPILFDFVPTSGRLSRRPDVIDQYYEGFT